MARVRLIEPATGSVVEVPEGHPAAGRWKLAEEKKSAPKRATRRSAPKDDAPTDSDDE